MSGLLGESIPATDEQIDRADRIAMKLEWQMKMLALAYDYEFASSWHERTGREDVRRQMTAIGTVLLEHAKKAI